MCICWGFFFFFLVRIIFESEHELGGGAKRERAADSALSTVPDAGFDPRTTRS